jgi:hypothetical protein
MERMWKEAIMAYCKVHVSVFLAGLTDTIKRLRMAKLLARNEIRDGNR